MCFEHKVPPLQTFSTDTELSWSPGQDPPATTPGPSPAPLPALHHFIDEQRPESMSSIVF